MGHAGKDDLEPRLAGEIDVRRVDGGAAGLGDRVDPRQAATDCAHEKSLDLYG